MNIQNNWFIGVVEAENDPKRMGRVKVRCFGYHTQEEELLPTEDLPWTQCIFPVDSPQSGFFGKSPALRKGSIVFGAFYDGDNLQDAIILGTVPVGVKLKIDSRPFSLGIGPGIPTAEAPRTDIIETAVTGVTSPKIADRPDEQYPEPVSVGAGAGNAIAKTAESQAVLGIKEDAGRNRDRGGKIRKYWSATSTPDAYGDVWCAAFACWAVKNSGVLPEDKLPTSAFSNDWIDNWARTNSDIVHVFNSALDAGGIQRGDILVRRNIPNSYGHVSIVTKGSGADGTFETVDGNYGNSVKRVTRQSRNLGAETNRHYILRIKDTGVPPNQGDATPPNQGLPESPDQPSSALFP